MASMRERLVSIAAEVLAAEGPSAVTVRRVAREAGLSHAAPLRHFRSHQQLLCAVAARGFEQLAAAVEAAVAGADPDDAMSRLQASGRGYVQFALGHPAVFALMFQGELLSSGDADLVAAAGHAFATLVHLVEQAQERAGWQRDRPARAVAGVLWATVHGMAHLWIGGVYAGPTGTQDVDAALTSISDLFRMEALA
jgi:AcrR family transcriptional regulator